MRSMRTLLALGFALALASTVGHAEDKMESKESKEMKAKKGADISAVLEARERQIQEAFNKKDADAFMSMVDPDAWMADPSGIAPVSTAPEMMKMAEIRSYTIEGYTARRIDEDCYVATYTWNGEGTMAGEPYPPGPWYCSTVWAKRGKEWKAVFHQETLGMEPPAEAETD